MLLAEERLRLDGNYLTRQMSLVRTFSFCKLPPILVGRQVSVGLNSCNEGQLAKLESGGVIAERYRRPWILVVES